MIGKLVLVLFMLAVSWFARAEKAYMKDRSTCQLNGESFVVEIRSPKRITVSDDDPYGERVQVLHKERILKVDLRNQGMGRYRFLTAHNEICPKPGVLTLPSGELAILLLKDNRPFPDTLVVLYLNLKTQSTDLMTTKVPTDGGLIRDGRAFLRLAAEDRIGKVGNVMIGSEKFHFVEKTLEPWMSFDGKNFRLDRDITYENFERKDLLKKDLLKDLDEFQKITYRLAVKARRSCLSFNQGRWSCR